MKPEDMLVMVVKSIVNYPHDVHVTCSDMGDHLLFSLHLNPRDRYKVVTGEAYQALCTLMKAAGGKLNRRIELTVP